MKSKRETLADREMRENDGLYSKRVRETLGCVKGEEKGVCVLYENAAMRHKRGRGNRRGRNFRATRTSIKDIDTEARREDSIQ